MGTKITLETLLRAKKHFDDLEADGSSHYMTLAEYRESIGCKGNHWELSLERKRTRHLFGHSM